MRSRLLASKHQLWYALLRLKGKDMSGQSIAAIAAWYIGFGASRGIPMEELFSACGLTPEDISSPDRLLPDQVLVSLWLFLAKRLPDIVLPIELAETFQINHLGIVGRILMASQSLRHSIEQSMRYQRLMDPSVSYSFSTQGEQFVFTLQHRPEVHALGLPIETMIAISFRLGRAMLGERHQLHRVTFSHPARYPKERYQQFFGAEVVFEAKGDSLYFPARLLDEPLNTTDPQLSQYLEALAKQMLSSLPREASPFITKVKRLLLQELPQGTAEQDRLAQRLGMSTRTLQRRLTEAGTSFQEVLDEVRSSTAFSLLRERQTPLVDIAFSLGYSNTASFYRAFKRWTNQTPEQWRAS